MEQIVLTGKLRELGKKSDIKNLRKAGDIPCALYGAGIENVNFTITEKDVKMITFTPNSYIIELDIEGKKYLSIFHAIQYHPVNDEPLHLDFLAIDPAKPVTINIPVTIEGSSAGVKLGGKLMPGARKLKVRGMINDLPDFLPVDVTELQIGKQISAGELSYEGISILTPKTTIVCAVKATRATVAAAAAAAKK